MYFIIFFIALCILILAGVLIFRFAKVILTFFDFFCIFVLTYFFIIGTRSYIFSDLQGAALLSNVELHTVFKILIYAAILGAWYGLQNISVKGYYVFRILSTFLTAILGSFVFTFFLIMFLQDSVEGFDLIWGIFIGIISLIMIFAFIFTKRRSLGTFKKRGYSNKPPFDFSDVKTQQENINGQIDSK